MGQIPKKPKGGPLDAKILFFKNCLLSFSKHSQLTAFVKLILKKYITWGHNTLYVCERSMHSFYSVHSTYRVHRPQECFENDQRRFLKKLFFHLRVGVLGISPTVFWTISGVNLYNIIQQTLQNKSVTWSHEGIFKGFSKIFNP